MQASVHSMYSKPEVSGVDLQKSLYSYSMNRHIYPALQGAGGGRKNTRIKFSAGNVFQTECL